MGKGEPPKRVIKALAVKKNREFLRSLFRLAPGTKKPDRLKALNKGDKKQRQLLIHILHHLTKGDIPVHKQFQALLIQSGKMDFMTEHFLSDDSVNRLLSATDAEQKATLAQVNNYHALLHHLVKE